MYLSHYRQGTYAGSSNLLLQNKFPAEARERDYVLKYFSLDLMISSLQLALHHLISGKTLQVWWSGSVYQNQNSSKQT